MASKTLGYITGGFAGLALAAALGYGMEQPKQAHDTVKDTQNSLVRTIDKIELGNLGDVIHDSWHDLMQGNPRRGLHQWERLNTGLGNTPLQDRRLASSHYGHMTDFTTYLDREADEKVPLSAYLPSGLRTKEEMVLALAGLGLGILAVGAYAKRK